MDIIGARNDLVENNIVIKAIQLLEKKTGLQLKTKITLKKNIPIGAGLGGGSSDAAATLLATNQLFDLNFSISELMNFALELGSDVPLFFHNYPTIGKSRGELLEKIQLEIDFPILLVNPGIHISTKEAFSNITPKPSSFDYSDILKLNINDWRQQLNNDFENGVFQLYPEIAKIKNTLNKNGAIFSLMSGTGSTVYGIFESIEEIKQAIDILPKSYFTFIGNT